MQPKRSFEVRTNDSRNYLVFIPRSYQNSSQQTINKKSTHISWKKAQFTFDYLTWWWLEW